MNVFVAGTGSFAAEVADWARSAGLNVLGLIEMLDPLRVGTVVHELPVHEAASALASAGVVLGLGGDRRTSWEKLRSLGWRAQTVAHPMASLAGDVRLGEGTVIGPHAVIGAGTVLGRHSIVSRGALVGHHVRIGDFATLNPGVNVGGNATIADDAFLGMSATIVNQRTVGEGAVVAAGAVVLQDVPAASRVQGVPARVVGGAS